MKYNVRIWTETVSFKASELTGLPASEHVARAGQAMNDKLGKISQQA